MDIVLDDGNTKSLMMRVLASPAMANFSGVVHGGELMKILDQVAYACATRYCGVGVVTMAVNNITFKAPIPIGSLMTFLASVNYTGKTSCEVGIKVMCEDIKKRVYTHCNSAYFTMVAIQDGKKMEIPALVPQSEEEKRRWEAALLRKQGLGK